MNPPKCAIRATLSFKKAFLTTTLLLLLGLLHDLLDDLLLLDQEGADDAVTDAVGAAGATVGTLDGLLGAGDLGVLAGTEGGDLCWSSINLPSFAMPSKVLKIWGKRTPGSLTPQSPHLGEVPLFLMCRYLCSPPGVLTTRTLLETVLYLIMPS